MPLAPSPYMSAPSFVGQPAMPPVVPGPGEGPQGPDLFDQLVLLIMSNPQWRDIFAGIGVAEALKKKGKTGEKPHRSNEELGQAGVPTGVPGQTGLSSPEQMIRGLQPAGLPPRLPGFGAV